NSERKALDLLHHTSLKTLSATLSVSNPLRQRRLSQEELYLEAINQTKVQEGLVKEAEQRFAEKKATLDGCVDQLHQLYEDMFVDPAAASANVLERMIHSEIAELRRAIPKTESSLDTIGNAQHLLYQARTTMEVAMKLLPGAAGFLDAQLKAEAPKDWWDLHGVSLIFASARAYEAYALMEQAHAVWADVPVISHENWKNGTKINNSIPDTLASLRGYRLKIETLLNKTVHPHLRSLEIELAHRRASLTSKLREWVDERAQCIERALRARGGLQDVDLEVAQRWLRGEREDNASQIGNGNALPGYRGREAVERGTDELPEMVLVCGDLGLFADFGMDTFYPRATKR
ncbi:hypothetical protein BC938DRAFT_482254, partial [Jimgerdemannia flammicorona]